MKRKTIILLTAVMLFFLAGTALAAQPVNPFARALDVNALVNTPQFSTSVQIILALSLISLVPFFLFSVTAFLRIVIVLALARTAIGTQQIPPNSVIISLALFLTVFVMTPVWKEINEQALIPLNQGQITQMQALEQGLKPLRQFMFKQTRESDLELFVGFSRIPRPTSIDDIPTYVLIPSFMLSELKTAFQIGFLLFIPFIIIDLTVANILLSLGMFMLSPVMISLPFKILLFVLVDGWNLIIRGLLTSFR